MLDRVSTVVLGLDGLGGAERFADYGQWEEWQQSQLAERGREAAKTIGAPSSGAKQAPVAAVTAKKKLSYMEQREFETIEQRIADAEKELQVRHDALTDPAIMSDGPRLHAASVEMEAAQKAIDALYARWAELEGKLS
jgi:ATP-binding cassette subfamily F protein uup